MSEFDLERTPLLAGLSVIEASAGTGKTWTIAHLIPRLLIQGQLQTLNQAVLVTFTEDAARELSERVRRTLVGVVEAVRGKVALTDSREDVGKLALKRLFDALPDEERHKARLRLDNALEESGQLQVSTIHAFCKRVLSQEAFLCGMPPGFQLLTDASTLVEEALRDLWRSRLAGDTLLAAAAAGLGWELQDDLKAWRALEPLERPRLHPQPQGLAGLRGALAEALLAMQANRQDLALLAQASQGGLEPKKEAQLWRVPAWVQALETLDPQAPSAALLADVPLFAGLDDWFGKRSKLGKEHAAAMAASVLVQAAGRAKIALEQLHWAWVGEMATLMQAQLQRRLRQNHATTYQGLIEQLHRALHAPGRGDELVARLRQVWTLALVDECQDTDPRQLQIFQRLFLAGEREQQQQELESRLILIGDPKQAIYGFRGADLKAYLAASAQAPAGQKSTLLKTQRSAPGLVRALNQLWSRQPTPMGDPGLEWQPGESALEDADLPLPDDGLHRLVAVVVDEQDLRGWLRSKDRLEGAAAAAAAAIRQTLGRPFVRGGAGAEVQDPAASAASVQPGDCCVLTRSNREASAVAVALRALAIPCVVRDDDDVLLSDESVDLLRVLYACLQPQRRPLRRGALATRLLGFDAAALLALDQTADELWRARLAGLADAWKRQGIAALIAGLEAGWPEHPGVAQQLSAEPDAERRLTDWRHVAELLAAEQARASHAPEALLHWFEAAQAAAKEATPADERLRRLEQDGSAVQVLTMHRAKGLEFDLVYCPYLWSANAGPRSRSEARTLRLPDGERALCRPDLLDKEEQGQLEAQGSWERLQEDLRLAYVALTRAKRRAWFLAGYVGHSDSSRSTAPASALDWWLRPSAQADAAGPAWCSATKQAKVLKLELGAAPPPSPQTLALRALAAADNQVWSLVDLPHSAEPWSSGTLNAETLCACPTLDRSLPTWSLTSYSRLAEGKPDGGSKDRYDRPAPAADSPPAGPSEAVLLADFPKGAHAGNALHELLEDWDFGPVDALALGRSLRRHGLQEPLKDGRDPAALLAQALPQWALAQLPGLDCPLGIAAADPKLSEWAFLLPLGAQGLNGTLLAQVFAKHARDEQERAYAQLLQALPGSVLAGYLHGYIDRLAKHGDRWAVLDWKSNHLGANAADYSQPALWQSAAEHHYILQLHLYLLALRRHLRQRDPQAHLAGAGLVFLRGLAAGQTQGLFWISPPPALLDDLDALLSPLGAA